MIDKTKVVLSLSFVVLIIITCFAGYVAYNCWQDEIIANAKVSELKEELKQLEQNIEKANRTIEKNSVNKIELENKSIELQERIDELLKNNECANELVPDAVSEQLYNRANGIRHAASFRSASN